MSYDVHFFILATIAAYFAFWGVVLHTTNLQSAVFLKFMPLVMAFTLGLMAFKII